MKNTATRDKLIDSGAQLISQQGYNATGINAVLKTCGVPKGSFYHYFSSKEDFGLAVIERFATTYDASLVTLLEDSNTPPLERLRRYFASGRDYMHECDHATGCLIGNLGQELSGQSDTFRDALNLVFQRWEQRLVNCLQDAQTRGDIATHTAPEALASFILTGWEGAILRAKTLKSVEPMDHFETILFKQVLVPS
ncbi:MULTISPECIES: TetR/AcrR family transcriptional regulator [Halomonas]|uniref:TetR family transcriptional regulator C-terminal domain-containing protein n=1 Tax=Halomonas casei TaxID=2742613 RepID=A0ABR9EYF7_9GAMM|nr:MULTISPECIES: TetR/AcrR family transcriptional regulator [Halomonas]MBE0399254.1 TetR family transcriptional regulator C-terminal domain-containing protein [Halomonas casei]PCC21751.1 TetR family transcriptional regulator [Halomonas sp. JB37]